MKIEIIEGLEPWQVVLRYSLGGVQLAYRIKSAVNPTWMLFNDQHERFNTSKYDYAIVKSASHEAIMNEAMATKKEAKETADAVDESISMEVLSICTAYEQGFGHGFEVRSLGNPYMPTTTEWQAWAHGYREGHRKQETTP